jgi:hypothetical protein
MAAEHIRAVVGGVAGYCEHASVSVACVGGYHDGLH